MLRHRKVIDVPEGLLSVGLHCRPGWSGSSQPVSPDMTPVFAHTDDVRLPSPAAASRFSNRAAHDIPFLEDDSEYLQPASSPISLSVSTKWPVSLLHTWWSLAADLCP